MVKRANYGIIHPKFRHDKVGRGLETGDGGNEGVAANLSRILRTGFWVRGGER